MPTVDVRLLPSLVAPGSLAGRTAVVIDQLRATSTIARALAVGASRIVPCVEVDEARTLADRLRAAGERIVTGGERHGVRIEGFDLDNSPESYTREQLDGATLVFTTTNGTAALRAAANASATPILACSIANLAATARACLTSNTSNTSNGSNTSASLPHTPSQREGEGGGYISARCSIASGDRVAGKDRGRFISDRSSAVTDSLTTLTPPDISIICAGTRNEVSQEDVLVAGALASILHAAPFNFSLASDDAVRIALSLYAQALARADGLYHAQADSRGGRNLIRINLEPDIRWCSTPDRYDFAVELDPTRWELTARHSSPSPALVPSSI